MEKQFSKDTLIIIPTFNEEKHIVDVIEQLAEHFSNILIIDDASEDNTYKLAISTGLCNVAQHSINCGQGTALVTGFNFFLKHTQLKYLITFDGDGQHKVSDSLKMLYLARKNKLNAVFASRFIGKKKTKIPIIRGIFIQIAVLFEKLFFGINLTDAHNGLRVLSRYACEKLVGLNSAYMAHATEIPSLLIKNGIEIIELPCEISYANPSESNNLFDSLNIISELIQNK